jgi:hypothetical protein
MRGPPVTPEIVVWAARRTVDQHSEPPSEHRATGRCAQCEPGERCRMLAWALTILNQWQRLP